jgi:hypothetical protein
MLSDGDGAFSACVPSRILGFYELGAQANLDLTGRVSPGLVRHRLPSYVLGGIAVAAPDFKADAVI